MKSKSPTAYQYKHSYLHHVVPVAVWLAAIGGVVWLFYQRSHRFEMVGIAQGQVRQVAATCTARVKSVSVQLFDHVKAGQTVAVVDTLLDNEQALQAQLKSRLAEASAEMEHLTAQLVPTQDTLLAEESNREVNRDSAMRRFVVDVENARLRILELRAVITSDQITLDDLAMEVNLIEQLVKEDAVVPYELEKVKVQYNSLAKKVEENENLLEQTKVDLELAQQRLSEFSARQLQHPSVDSALEVIRKEIKVQEELMRGLLDQLEALRSRQIVELKAPIDGVVVPIPVRANEALLRRAGEKVLARPGEVVTAGEPIAAIAEPQAGEIIAYVAEQQSGQLRENTTVELINNSEPAQIARSQVSFVGPMVEMVPQRLWRNPNIPQWGRPIMIKVPPGLRLVPGQMVGVRSL
jgi:multidrug resistance efflux pump